MRMGKLSGVTALLIAGLVLGTPAAAQISSSGHGGDGFSADPGVLPPFSNPFGQSYSEWSAQWWQWTYSLPIDQHPLFDTADCGEGQMGRVWFLGGTFTAAPVPGGDPNVVIGEAVRECTVPPGTPLFFPIVNAECNTVEDPAATEADLRACANFLADHIQNLQVTIDGVEVEHLGLYRAESPLFTIGPFPDNNILDVAPGSTANSVSDGFYLMLAPLSRGEHEIHFEGAAIFTLEEDGFDFTFILDITYNMTVNRTRSRTLRIEADSTPDPGEATQLEKI